MIEARFFSDINYQSFLEEVSSSLGSVPGSVDFGSLTVTLTPHEFAACEHEFRELVRDYGGQVRHRAV